MYNLQRRYVIISNIYAESRSVKNGADTVHGRNLETKNQATEFGKKSQENKNCTRN